MSESKELAVINEDHALEMINKRKSILSKLVTSEDVQQIQGKEFKKKSYWRKVAVAYGVSIEIIKEWREDHADGSFSYFFVCRALAGQSGLHADGTGACSSSEKGLQKTVHNTRAIAETRAKNRAISDLLAFGEVSAEEIVDDTQHSTPHRVSSTYDIIPFGKQKGESWETLDTSALQSAFDYIERQYDDPAKAKYKENNAKYLHVIQGILDARMPKQSTPAQAPAGIKQATPADIKKADETDAYDGIPDDGTIF